MRAKTLIAVSVGGEALPRPAARQLGEGARRVAEPSADRLKAPERRASISARWMSCTWRRSSASVSRPRTDPATTSTQRLTSTSPCSSRIAASRPLSSAVSPIVPPRGSLPAGKDRRPADSITAEGAGNPACLRTVTSASRMTLGGGRGRLAPWRMCVSCSPRCRSWWRGIARRICSAPCWATPAAADVCRRGRVRLRDPCFAPWAALRPLPRAGPGWPAAHVRLLLSAVPVLVAGCRAPHLLCTLLGDATCRRGAPVAVAGPVAGRCFAPWAALRPLPRAGPG